MKGQDRREDNLHTEQPEALKELQVSFKRYGKLLIQIKLKAQNVK